MKALSLKQPWANMIVLKQKTIETRTWKTEYRGDLLICSSKSIDSNMVNLILNESSSMVSKSVLEKPLGVALCVAELYDCVPMQTKHEVEAFCRIYHGAYSWMLRNVRRIKQFPVKGQLRFFDVDDEKITFVK